MNKKYKAPEPRFEFGENWQRFLSVLDDEKIKEAEDSIKDSLKISSLKGRSFLDAGSGSGLFSLAAYRLGADKVFSFDFDPKSVACTRELKKKYSSDPDNWVVEQGSVLDKQYLDDFPLFDVVYSWGVLHHTGAMWQAMDKVSEKVAEGGYLFPFITIRDSLAVYGLRLNICTIVFPLLFVFWFSSPLLSSYGVHRSFGIFVGESRLRVGGIMQKEIEVCLPGMMWWIG